LIQPKPVLEVVPDSNRGGTPPRGNTTPQALTITTFIGLLTEFKTYLHRHQDALPLVKHSLVLRWTSEQPQKQSRVFTGHCTPD